MPGDFGNFGATPGPALPPTGFSSVADELGIQSGTASNPFPNNNWDPTTANNLRAQQLQQAITATNSANIGSAWKAGAAFLAAQQQHSQQVAAQQAAAQQTAMATANNLRSNISAQVGNAFGLGAQGASNTGRFSIGGGPQTAAQVGNISGNIGVNPNFAPSPAIKTSSPNSSPNTSWNPWPNVATQTLNTATNVAKDIKQASAVNDAVKALSPSNSDYTAVQIALAKFAQQTHNPVFDPGVIDGQGGEKTQAAYNAWALYYQYKQQNYQDLLNNVIKGGGNASLAQKDNAIAQNYQARSDWNNDPKFKKIILDARKEAIKNEIAAIKANDLNTARFWRKMADPVTDGFQVAHQVAQYNLRVSEVGRQNAWKEAASFSGSPYSPKNILAAQGMSPVTYAFNAARGLVAGGVKNIEGGIAIGLGEANNSFFGGHTNVNQIRQESGLGGTTQDIFTRWAHDTTGGGQSQGFMKAIQEGLQGKQKTAPISYTQVFNDSSHGYGTYKPPAWLDTLAKGAGMYGDIFVNPINSLAGALGKAASSEKVLSSSEEVAGNPVGIGRLLSHLPGNEGRISNIIDEAASNITKIGEDIIEPTARDFLKVPGVTQTSAQVFAEAAGRGPEALSEAASSAIKSGLYVPKISTANMVGIGLGVGKETGSSPLSGLAAAKGGLFGGKVGQWVGTHVADWSRGTDVTRMSDLINRLDEEGSDIFRKLSHDSPKSFTGRDLATIKTTISNLPKGPISDALKAEFDHIAPKLARGGWDGSNLPPVRSEPTPPNRVGINSIEDRMPKLIKAPEHISEEALNTRSPVSDSHKRLFSSDPAEGHIGMGRYGHRDWTSSLENAKGYNPGQPVRYVDIPGKQASDFRTGNFYDENGAIGGTHHSIPVSETENNMHTVPKDLGTYDTRNPQGPRGSGAIVVPGPRSPVFEKDWTDFGLHLTSAERGSTQAKRLANLAAASQKASLEDVQATVGKFISGSGVTINDIGNVISARYSLPVRAIGQMFVSWAEKIPPGQLNLTDELGNVDVSATRLREGVARLIETFRKYTGGDQEWENDIIGQSGKLADRIVADGSSTATGTIKDLKQLLDRIPRQIEGFNSLPSGSIKSFYDDFGESVGKALRNGEPKEQIYGYSLDEAGKPIPKTEPQMPTQIQNDLRLHSRQDIVTGIRQELANGGSWLSKARLTIGKGNVHLLTLANGREISLGSGLKAIHTFWKALVVTNALMPLLGGLSAYVLANRGYLGQDAKGDPFGAALGGAVLGLGAGLGRFMARNQILDQVTMHLGENTLLDQGYLRGRTQILMDQGIEPAGFSFGGRNQLIPEAASGRFNNGVLSASDPQNWALMSSNNPHFLEGWSNIINNQINPEFDPVARILLQGVSGEISEVEAVKLLQALKNSEQGSNWLRSFAQGNVSSWDEGVSREASFIQTHMDPEGDLARARLIGRIPTDNIAQVTEWRPPYVSAPKLWGPVKYAKDIFSIGKSSLARLATEQGTARGTRDFMASRIYENENNRLITMGQTPTDAHRIAEATAIQRSDAIMFRVDNFSRAADTGDALIPFLGHRQFTAQTWIKLAADNPGRTVMFGEMIGRGFTAGVQSGILKKDPQTGAWTFPVPGSAFLSQALFGVRVELRAPVASLLVVTEGMASPEGGFKMGSLLPLPGGPFVTVIQSLFAKAYPNYFDPNHPDFMGKTVQNILFPFGASGTLNRPESGYLWASIMGAPAPWDFLHTEDVQNSINKVGNDITKELIYEHLKEHPTQTDWVPSKDAIKKATSQFMFLRGFLGAVMPATPHPFYPGAEDFNAAKAHYTAAHGGFDFAGFTQAFPAFWPYTTKHGTYTEPEASWTNAANHPNKQNFVGPGQQHEFTPNDFRRELIQGRNQNAAFQDLRNINTIQNPAEREQALETWRAQHPEEAQLSVTKYNKTADLARILLTYPKNAQQQAIYKWSQFYSVSPAEYNSLTKEIHSGLFTIRSGGINPWREARPPEVIAQDVKSHVNGGPTDSRVLMYVSSLAPTEQIAWAKEQQHQLTYDTGATLPTGQPDPLNVQKINDTFKMLGTFIATVYTNYPFLVTPASTGITDFSGKIIAASNRSAIYDNTGGAETIREQKFQNSQQIGEESQKVGALYNQINDVNAQLAALKAGGAKLSAAGNPKGPAATALYNRIYGAGGLQAQITAVQNSYYNSHPQLAQVQSDTQALMVYVQEGNTTQAVEFYKRVLQDNADIKWIPSSEQAGYLARNDRMKQAYTDGLMSSLTIDPKNPYVKSLDMMDGSGKAISKLYWGDLTQFQKDLLTAQLPLQAVQYLMAQTRPAFQSYASGKGHYTYSQSKDELNYAYSLMNQYTQRTKGELPPPAYADYTALPKNQAVRSQFLKDHPEVASWIKRGPLANMPPIYQAIVADIMQRNGKWTGQIEDATEITDLAWARTQLQNYNKRGGANAPAAYEQWLNMPTGVDKANYLKANPEIAHWLQLGPMRNMPQSYQAVVRDIMQRYGEWTQQQDPLGQTLTGYYATPAFGRTAYLQAHPELTAYWAAIRDPAQNAMFDLKNQYFALPDSGSRKLFLSAHPELSQNFLDSRTQRYNDFLNQVAQYMGANPDTFTQYLTSQNTILEQLLKRFGSSPMLREAPLTVTKANVRSSESGRQRG